MSFVKENAATLQSGKSASQKHQTILFFKSYLRYLKQMISNTTPVKQQNVTIFDLKKTSLNVSLQLFLQRVLSYFKCGISAYICALSFIDKLLGSQSAKNDNIVVSIKNIFKILSVALLIATKNFDDFYYSNAYYARVCGLTLQQLNNLEKQFLKMIDFDVFVDGHEYKLYETRIHEHKQKISDEIVLSQRKENMIDEENRSMSEKINKLISRQTCDGSQEENDTNVQVEVAA